MKGARVLVLGDGKHEIGEKGAFAGEGGGEPALLCLVRRLLGDPDGLRTEGDLFRTVRAAHQKGRNKLVKKTVSAIRMAKKAGYDGLAIVVDRDGEHDRDRIGALREGRDAADEPSFACALGEAIEAFDAWMIADAKAVKGCGGKPSEVPGKAEAVPKPKAAADAMFGTTDGIGLGAVYSRIARSTDLDRLKDLCPDGFKPFAEEVRKRILPAVSS